MRKKTSQKDSLKVFKTILLIALVVGVGYGVYSAYLRPEPAPIFVIDPVINLTYGETTVTGELRKDVPIGEDGNFLLVLADSRVIVLDISGVDHLVGQTVTLKGNLSPSAGQDLPLTMNVQELTI